jgi:intracellular septation protein
MNHFLFDLLPVLLFFVVFKYQGIYAATWVGILSTLCQVLVYRFTKKNWDKMQVTTLAIFVLFGGMTLYFHNPIFVKWKPTIIFWVFALVLLGSHFIGRKPMMQRLLEGALNNQNKGNAQDLPIQILLPDKVGKKINLAWFLFFLILGAVNVYVAYHLSDNAWVNFKLYGITSATLVFSLLQTVFLMRYIKN